MFEKRTNVSVYITDEKIGFYEYNLRSNQLPKFGFVELERGTVVTGDIKEPEVFYKKCVSLFKKHRISPKVVRFIINDQNILLKEITIDKEELTRLTIEQYIVKQMGKTIHFPFEHPVFTHHIRSENETSVKVLIIITDGEMLHDYYDVFERMNVKEIILDLPSLSLYNAYITKTKKQYDHLMMVSMNDKTITIKIIEENVPIFSVTEETEDSSDKYFDVLENYVERIINFYRFNMNKGTKSIENIVFYNFSEDIPNKNLREKLKERVSGHPFDICEIKDMSDVLYDVPKICLLSYAGGVEKDPSIKLYEKLNFNLNRVPAINQTLHFVMAMSFLIISSMLLIYIPYYLQNDEIINQMNINSVLQNQLEDLQRQTPVERVYSSVERNYSNAYDFLSEQETFGQDEIADLIDLVTIDMTLMSYTVNHDEKTITLVITSQVDHVLDEYLLSIYETHGVVSEPTSIRWMTTRPETRLLTPIIMEVTITYA